MRIFVIGAGQVGTTIVEALHEDHEISVLDTEASRLQALTGRFDVAVFEGDGTSRKDLAAAGIDDREPRHRLHVPRRSEPRRGHVRTARDRERDDGHPHVEHRIRRALARRPARRRLRRLLRARDRVCDQPHPRRARGRQTDVFADGQVQVGEFDVDDDASPQVLGVPLRDAPIPESSKVAAVIRGEETILPGGDDEIRNGDRIVVIGSPRAIKAWSALLWPEGGTVRDVVIYGAGRVGSAIARVLLSQGISVRMIEASREQARRVAEALPKARVFNATGFDVDFLQRERIGQSQAGIFAMRDDAKNQYAASIAQVHGIPFTVAIAHDAVSVAAFDRAGIDVSINPRAVTAEEIVRFAHDPRTQQVAMIEGNRYEVLDVTTRESSRYIGMAFRDMPVHGSIIGAIVRNGQAIFPHGGDVLEAGDRVIIFTEAANAPWVVEAL